MARHVRELAALLAPRADVLVLRPHRRSFVALEGTGEHREARLWFHRDDDWAALAEILRALGVARLHFHHVQGLPPQVLDLGRAVGCPWDVTVHDYYPICPQYQLTDATGRYCGEPDAAGCARCLAASPAQWPMDIAQWRAAFGRLLGEAERVIAPSRDAAARIARHFPHVSPVTWPHAEPRALPAAARKVLVLGGLSPAKGMDTLVACARDARARGLALRFRVVGHLAWPVDGEDLPLSFTGEYPEGTLATLVEQERADAVFFPAQWPETWSYTLSAAIDSGLPILATDLGAFPERLAGVADARIVAWDAPAAHFNDAAPRPGGRHPAGERPRRRRRRGGLPRPPPRGREPGPGRRGGVPGLHRRARPRARRDPAARHPASSSSTTACGAATGAPPRNCASGCRPPTANSRPRGPRASGPRRPMRPWRRRAPARRRSPRNSPRCATRRSAPPGTRPTWKRAPRGASRRRCARWRASSGAEAARPAPRRAGV